MSRRQALALAVLGATGCGAFAWSELPVFRSAPPEPAAFRAGVWAAPEPGCKADLSRPIAEWPVCARLSILGERGPLLPGPVGQYRVYDPATAQDLEKTGRTGFYVLRPVAQDARGRITGFETWLAVCEPVRPGKLGQVVETVLPSAWEPDTCPAAPGAKVRVSRWVRDA